MSVWIRLLRPFTLLPPLIGMISGAASAWGSGRSLEGGGAALLAVGLGSLMAALLNGASNVLNQVHDIDLDAVNKPGRPLPRGEVTPRAATGYALALYAASLGLAGCLQPAGRPELFVIVAITAFLTWAYSGPPLRWRRSWWAAPLVIALPRGGLLKVAGWAVLAPVFGDREPWVLGGVFFLFVLGCASTKDFGDMEGDRRGGVVTLPLRFGPRRAAALMAPFYVVPWLALGGAAWIETGGRRILSADPVLLTVVAAVLAVQGALTAWHLVRHAEDLRDPVRGRTAWRLLYVLMMEAQVGVAVVYLV